MRQRIKLFTVLSLALCGCSQIPGKLHIMEANAWNSREMYSRAIVPYMRALEFTESEPYGEYGLGSVYFAMGEDNAALDRYASAQKLLETLPPDAGRELRYRIHYNTGVVLFSKEDFSGAADSFREALRTDGRRIEAKRNLELSLISLSRENPSGGSDSTEGFESRAAFFEYIRQRELNQWRNRDWPEEETSSEPDY